MLTFIQSIFERGERAATPGVDRALVERAVERAVDGSDPRLRALSGYRRKLSPAVERTVQFVIGLVEALPPPAALDAQGYASDPRLRAMLASSARLGEIAGESRALRSYLRDLAGAPPDQIYALLVADHAERTSFGMDLQGDQVRREVLQTVVDFRNHRLVAPSGNEQETRRELMRRAFDQIVAMALARSLEAVHRHDALARERDLLAAKLRDMKSGDWGLACALGEADATGGDVAELERHIEQIERELLEIGANSATLEHKLAALASVLSAPEEQVELAALRLSLDRLNVKRTPDSAKDVYSVSFDELRASDGRRAVVLLGRFPRSQIAAPRDPLVEARRLLG